MNFSAARDYIINRLRNELDPGLCYHSLDHTLDVYYAVQKLNSLENVSADYSVLLETAALYHDAGMMMRYKDHEEASVQIAQDVLPEFGYSNEEIEMVSRLIMATRLPQKAYDRYEMIICDADLDSLGRNDFFVQSFRLRLEWKEFDIIDYSVKEWLKFQIYFLENHDYFTKSARELREAQKTENLRQLKEIKL